MLDRSGLGSEKAALTQGHPRGVPAAQRPLGRVCPWLWWWHRGRVRHLQSVKVPPSPGPFPPVLLPHSTLPGFLRMQLCMRHRARLSLAYLPAASLSWVSAPPASGGPPFSPPPT